VGKLLRGESFEEQVDVIPFSLFGGAVGHWSYLIDRHVVFR
jgi:hypothetical protein